MTRFKAVGYSVLLGCLASSQTVLASFTNVTSTAGLTSTGVSAGAAWGDYDKDGCVDLAVNGNDGVVLNHSNCDGTFTDVAAASGVSGVTAGRAIVWADYDNDSDLDLFAAGNDTANALFRNNGDGTFTNVATAAGVDDTNGSAGAAFGDYDKDGFLDLYVANRTGDNRVDSLYRNNGDGTFTDVAVSLGIDGGSTRWTWMPAWLDYDNDGELDLYLAVDFGNDVLYKNNGNGTFTDVTASATAGEPQHGMGLAVGDIQGDGCLDILVTNNSQEDDIEHRRSVIHSNNCDGTGFTIVSVPAGIEDRDTVDWGANFVDFDNDGDQDISITSGAIISSGEPNVLYENNNGILTNVTAAMGAEDSAAAWSSVWADYDNDGDLDQFVVNQKEGSNVLFRNDNVVGNHIKIELKGTTSNRFGVGARVEIVTGSDTQVRFIQAGLSFSSAEELLAFFGLGDSDTIDEINVFWPNGIVDNVTNVTAINQTVTIVEGSGIVTVGSLTGVVTDPLGEVFEGARVRISNTEVGGFLQMDTDAAGVYLFEDLAPGTYTIKVTDRVTDLDQINTETIIETAEDEVLNLQFDEPDPSEENVIKFSEVSVEAKVANEVYFGDTGHSLGVNWLDYNNDGNPDLFLPNGFGFPANLYRNLGNGNFRKVNHYLPSFNYGVNQEMSGARFGDYDNDGDTDIFIAVGNEQFELHGVNEPDGRKNLLLKNNWVENGNQAIFGQPLFTEVGEQAGISDFADPHFGSYWAKRAKTMGLFDYDQDGCLDLFWGQMVLQAPGEEENKNTLLRNNCDGTGTYTDVTDSAGIAPDSDYYRPTLAFQSVHLDDDMHPDMYVCNVHEASPFHHDVIYKNNGDGTFTDNTAASPGVGDDSGSCMGVDVADIDLNGTWDLYTSDVFATQNDSDPKGNPLYLGNGDGTFQDNSADVAGIAANFSWGVNFADFDLDGDEDLFVAGKIVAATFLYSNNGDGTFTDVTESSGIAAMSLGELRGAAVADYDGDGDLDFATVRHNGQLYVLRNDTETIRKWIKLKLVGVASNKSAIGAVVKLVTNTGVNMMRQVKGGSGAHSQDNLDVHFGTKLSGIQKITIEWPSGTVDELTSSDVVIDSRMTIVEGSFPQLN